MSDDIFSKIIAREVPADIVYEDDDSLAFRDIAAAAPIHILVIPKKLIVSVEDIADEDAALVGKLFLTIQKVARQEGFAEAGYRVITNCGKGGGQEVPHLHFHVLSGGRLPGLKN
jgi:histidine triad (HIT) family protein